MSCDLVSNNFSKIVQAMLAICCFLTIIIKRYLESPKRIIIIYVYDVSKQVVSGLYCHILNILFSIYLVKKTNYQDQCIVYFTHFLMDVILGIPFNYFLIKLINFISVKYNNKYLKTGNYIEDNSNFINYSFCLQLIVWCLIISFVKTIILFMVLLPFSDSLFKFSKILLTPFIGNTKLELVMVMMFFPILFNSIQFWIQDNFLKGPLQTEQNSNLELLSTSMYNINCYDEL